MTTLQINTPLQQSVDTSFGTIEKPAKQIFPSIDIMRIICALLVVSIHTRPFEEYGPTYVFIFQQILPRFAVPFFFVVSGYFLSASLFKKQDITIVVKYIKRILFTYTLWTIIYFLTVIPSIIRGNISLVFALKRLVKNYFIYGSHYHLWYFPALIFSVLVFAFFYKINRLNLLVYLSVCIYLVGLLGVSYMKIGNSIPVLNKIYSYSQFPLMRRVVFMGLPFFVLGYLVYKAMPLINRISNRKLWIISMIIAICYVLEIILVIKFKITTLVLITGFMYLLTAAILVLCIKNPLAGLGKASTTFRNVSNFTYYSHPFIMLYFGKVFIRLFHHPLSQTPTFFVISTAVIATSLLICKINNKYLLKLMN